MIDFSKTKYTIFRHEKDKVIALLKKHKEYKACRGYVEYRYKGMDYNNYPALWEQIEQAFDLYEHSLCLFAYNQYVTTKQVKQNPDMAKVAVVFIGPMLVPDTRSLLQELNELNPVLMKVK